MMTAEGSSLHICEPGRWKHPFDARSEIVERLSHVRIYTVGSTLGWLVVRRHDATPLWVVFAANLIAISLFQMLLLLQCWLAASQRSADGSGASDA